MKNNKKQLATSAAVKLVIDHFKTPIAVVEFLNELMAQIRAGLQITNSDPRERAEVSSTQDLIWLLSKLQKCFILMVIKSEYYEDEINWLSDPDNPHEIYNALRTALIHSCYWQGNFSASDFRYADIEILSH
jgi:hypothetical protein